MFPPIISVQPMTQPVGGIVFYRPRYASDKGLWEPCVIDRLAALTDPGMAKRVEEYDKGFGRTKALLDKLKAKYGA